MVNVKGCFFTLLFLPFEPAVGRHNGAPVVLQRLKHTSTRRRFITCVNERLLIQPLRAGASEHEVGVERPLTLAEEQHLCARRHVEAVNGFRIEYDFVRFQAR